MTKSHTRPCCFCNKPIEMIPNTYMVVWDDGTPLFAHEKCAEESGEVGPELSPEEICKRMRPMVDAAFNELRKKFGSH